MGRHAYTKEQFVLVANRLHSDMYDYTSTNYVNMSTKIIVTCKKHGDFITLPSSHVKQLKQLKQSHTKHLSPSGCPVCGKEAVRKRNKQGAKTTKQFVEEASEVHQNKYDRIKNNYVQNNNMDLLRIPYTKITNIPQILTRLLITN